MNNNTKHVIYIDLVYRPFYNRNREGDSTMKKFLCLFLSLMLVGCTQTSSLDTQELKIGEHGASYYDGMLRYGVVLKNNSENAVSIKPAIKVYAKDEKGQVIASATHYASYVLPHDHTYYGNSLKCAKKPDHVDFEVKSKKWNALSDLRRVIKSDSFDVNVKSRVNDDEDHHYYRGTITNKSRYNAHHVEVVLIFKKNKKIVFVSNVDIGALKADETKAFTTIMDSHFEYDAVSFYGQLQSVEKA